jgi:hypothetical protein
MTTSLGIEIYHPMREHQEIGKISFPRIPIGTTMLSSTGSSGGDDGSQQSSNNYQLYQRLTVDDSDNIKNRGFAASSSQYQPTSRSLHRAASGSDRDSSTLANTGAASLQYMRKATSSSLNHHQSDHGSKPSSNSLAGQHPTIKRSNSLGENSVNSDGGTDILIEEKRKRPNGDGHTIHRYTRGKLLGKGGFAKVYLCTAMDTGKNYAVKVVPKANLVKARARQKVRTYFCLTAKLSS